MNERPLSPHLQIYRLPPTALLSITHRVTGALILLGLVLWVACLIAAADGPERYAVAQYWLRSIAGRIFLLLWTFSLFLHLCHGVRHLIWDTGHGFARETLNRHAWLELLASLSLTGLTVYLAM